MEHVSRSCDPKVRQQDLVEHACKAKLNAYCPISKFAVGASLLTENGLIFSGTNVENMVLPCGWCAEVSAIGTAVSNGYYKFIAYAVSTNTEDYVSPCGRCRQVMFEFSEPNTIIYLINQNGNIQEQILDDLLPIRFKSKYVNY